MNLYFIRHGQSANNAGFPRVPDPPLTKLGAEQARHAALALAEVPPLAALYASPMRRAIETANLLSETLHLAPHLLPDLCEAGGLRELPGMCRSEILQEWPTVQMDTSITDSGWWNAAPEDTDEALVYARAHRALNLLRQRHEAEEEDIAIVTHGTFGSAMLSVLLGMEAGGYTRFIFNNCALTRALLEDRSPHDDAPISPGITPPQRVARVLWHNRTAHLPPALLT